MEKKIAIFHNYLDNIGGAEKVVLTLARELNADVYSTNINKEKIEKMGFHNLKLISIGKVPINSPYKQQLALWRFKKLNLRNKYNFYIIAGDWAISGAVKNHPNLWYVHSPIREIWDACKYTRNEIVPMHLRKIFDLWVRYNRTLNIKYVKSADKIASNSNNTKKRIKKFLNREASIVYPPIDTSKFHYKKNGNCWLSVNRLLKPKRVEMQTEAFKKLPDENLIIVGSYERSSHFKKYARYIKSIKPDNVRILSWVNEKELINLYANCKGFITTSMDEDFGMAAIEAMASGKPVIAPNEGGYKETVINNRTGTLISNIEEDKLAEAIKKVGKNPAKYKLACLKQAKKFDTKVFIKKIKALINKT